jgi:hypothetical protein
MERPVEEDEDDRRMRDDVRSVTTAHLVEDALWRFNEEHEDTLSVYDVIGMVIEDLVKEGMCPACIGESINEAFTRAGVDPNVHVNEEDGLRVMANRPDGDVFH